MKYPILYSPSDDNFFKMGHGPMTNILSACVTEERNGIFIFEAEVLVDNVIYPLIKENGIIKADAGHKLKGQRFRIKRITPKIDGKAEIYAEHISYLTQELSLKPEVFIKNQTAKKALDIWKSALLDENPIKVSSDVETVSSTHWRVDAVENSRQALGGVRGSILDNWGGEYLFDNYHISLLKKRGKVANTLLAYGRNITDFEQDRNISNTYTSVIPYAIYSDDNQKEHLVFPKETVIDSKYVKNYPNRKALPVNFSSEFEKDSLPTEAKLRTLAERYIKDNEIGLPSISIKLSFLDLSKVADYEHLSLFEELNLCDEVRVIFPKLGVNTTAKVIRVVWNCLTETYDEIEIGQKRMTLSNIISKQDEKIKEIVTSTNETLISSNGKNTIFYGLFGKDGLGQPKATKVGDMWYKPDGDDTIFYIWDGLIWKEVMSTKGVSGIQEVLDEIETKIDEAKKDTDKAKQKAEDSIRISLENAQKVDRTEKLVGDSMKLNENLNKEMLDIFSNSLSNVTNALSKQIVEAKSDSINALLEARNALTDSQKALEGVTGVKKELTAEVKKLDGLLQSKVALDEFNALKNTVTKQGTEVTQTKDLLKLKADKTEVNAVNKKVDRTSSELKVESGKITALNTKTDGNTAQIGKLESSFNGINSTVLKVKSDLDNLDLSTRNLLRNSSWNLGQEFWTGFIRTRKIIPPEKDKEKSSILSLQSVTGGTAQIYSKGIEVTEGESYTLSWEGFYPLIEEGRNNTVMSIRMVESEEISNSATTALQSLYFRWSMSKLTEKDLNTWKKLTWTFTIPKGKSGIMRIIPYWGSTDGKSEAKYRELMLVKNNRPVDWSPAPEDLATAEEFSSLKQDLDGFKTVVGNKADRSQFDQVAGEMSLLVAKQNESHAQIKINSESISNLVVKNKDEFSVIDQKLGSIQSQVSGKADKTQVTQLENQWSVTAKELQGVKDEIPSVLDVSQAESNKWRVGYLDSEGNEKIATASSYRISERLMTVGRRTLRTLDSDGNKIKASFYFYDSKGNFIDRVLAVTEAETTALTFYTKVEIIINNLVNKGEPIDCYIFKDIKPQPKYALKSQISLLKDNINMAVFKDDVVNQINISTEGILIDGQKVHITGKTTIDDAVIGTAQIKDLAITDAKIGNLSANKIITGTFDAAKANIINMNANNITSGYINASRIQANSITADKLAANAIQVGFNSMGNVLKIDSQSLRFYEGNILTGRLDGDGMQFNYGNRYIGRTGHSSKHGDTSVRGIANQLAPQGDYITWSYREKQSDKNYTTMMTLDPKGRMTGFKGVDIGMPTRVSTSWSTYMYMDDIISAISKLRGLGQVCIPETMYSDGTVASWIKVNFSR